MTVGLVGTDHTRAPLAVRERLSVDGERYDHLLDLLDGDPLIGEAAILATCNRVEVYVAAADVPAALDRATVHLATATGIASTELGPLLAGLLVLAYFHRADDRRVSDLPWTRALKRLRLQQLLAQVLQVRPPPTPIRPSRFRRFPDSAMTRRACLIGSAFRLAGGPVRPVLRPFLQYCRNRAHSLGHRVKRPFPLIS